MSSLLVGHQACRYGIKGQFPVPSKRQTQFLYSFPLGPACWWYPISVHLKSLTFTSPALSKFLLPPLSTFLHGCNMCFHPCCLESQQLWTPRLTSLRSGLHRTLQASPVLTLLSCCCPGTAGSGSKASSEGGCISIARSLPTSECTSRLSSLPAKLFKVPFTHLQSSLLNPYPSPAADPPPLLS